MKQCCRIIVGSVEKIQKVKIQMMQGPEMEYRIGFVEILKI